MKTLESLFLEELCDIYDAEHRLLKALPKMVRAATHEELRAAFEAHLEETEEQVTRLEEVFGTLGKKPKATKCEAMTGLVKEADEIAAENKGSPTINAALVAAAQKVEHYEIATYGCLVEWATTLGNSDAAELLEETLKEEKAADEKLTEVARECCNEAAEQGEDEKPRQSPKLPNSRRGGVKGRGLQSAK